MRKEIAVGLLAIIAIVVSIWGYNFIKGSNLLKKSDYYLVEYHALDGLSEGNQVVWRGMSVGLVKKIEPRYADDVSLIVTIELHNRLQLPNETKAIITSDGIMGGKLIRLEFDRPCQANCLKNGDYLQPGMENILASMIPKEELQGYMGIVKNNIGGILDTVDRHIADGDTELGKMMSDLKGTIRNLEATTNSLNRLLSSTSGKLDNIASNLEGITEAMALEKEQIRKTINNVEVLTSRLAQARVDSTFQLTNQMLSETQASLTEVKSMLAQINKGEGTLGKLSNDAALYNNLSSSARELDLLLQDFRLNPKRYVNVSVFGKKQRDYELPENDPADTLTKMVEN